MCLYLEIPTHFFNGDAFLCSFFAVSGVRIFSSLIFFAFHPSAYTVVSTSEVPDIAVKVVLYGLP